MSAATPRQPLRVVITGESSGIGAATALAFAREGATLMLAARGMAGLESIARSCRGGRPSSHQGPLQRTEFPRFRHPQAG